MIIENCFIKNCDPTETDITYRNSQLDLLLFLSVNNRHNNRQFQFYNFYKESKNVHFSKCISSQLFTPKQPLLSVTEFLPYNFIQDTYIISIPFNFLLYFRNCWWRWKIACKLFWKNLKPSKLWRSCWKYVVIALLNSQWNVKLGLHILFFR